MNLGDVEMGLRRAARGVLVLSLMLALAGCDMPKTKRVDVYLPVSRLESPEPAPQIIDVGGGVFGAARMRLTDDQTQASPQTAKPTITDGHEGAQIKVSANPAPFLSISGKNYGDWQGGQAKVMPLEPVLHDTPFSFALTYSYADGSQDFDYEPDFVLFGSSDEPSAHTHVRSTLRDYAAIAGVHVTRELMVYGGAFYSDLRYHGDHTHWNSSSGTVDTVFKDQARSRGANIGVSYRPSRWVEVLAEVSRATVHAGLSGKDVWAPGISAQAFFGSRRSEYVPRAVPETVTVIPAQRSPAAPGSSTAGAAAEGEPRPVRGVKRDKIIAGSMPASGDVLQLLPGALLYDRPQKQAAGQRALEGQRVTLEHYQGNGDGHWWYVSLGSATAWVREADLKAVE
jgi:hypothetical protein